MKNLRLIRAVLAGLFILLIAAPDKSRARSVLARHEERFYKTVNRTSLAIALFYQDYRAVRHCDPEESESMMHAERIFERVASMCRFKEGGLLFIKASILCSDMQNLAHSLGIMRIPACILFKDGELVCDPDGQPALLVGIHSQESIISFVKKYLQQDLYENRKEYIHRQEVRALAGPQISVGFGVGCWGPGWGYYDPLDSYPWYYYGGCRSFGCGGSRGCGRSSNCCRPCRCK